MLHKSPFLSPHIAEQHAMLITFNNPQHKPIVFMLCWLRGSRVSTRWEKFLALLLHCVHKNFNQRRPRSRQQTPPICRSAQQTKKILKTSHHSGSNYKVFQTLKRGEKRDAKNFTQGNFIKVISSSHTVNWVNRTHIRRFFTFSVDVSIHFVRLLKCQSNMFRCPKSIQYSLFTTPMKFEISEHYKILKLSFLLCLSCSSWKWSERVIFTYHMSRWMFYPLFTG